jgi:hypothetical protein
MRFAFGVLILVLSWPASAHDQYTDLKDPFGFSCCGNQDCEAIEDFAVHKDGSVDFYSRRQSTWVYVPSEQISWIALPGAPAHWCGHSMDDYVGSYVLTFCAFVDPGGT